MAGVYLYDLRDIDRALEEYGKAAAIDPDDWMVYIERSWVYRTTIADHRLKPRGSYRLSAKLVAPPGDYDGDGFWELLTEWGLFDDYRIWHTGG